MKHSMPKPVTLSKRADIKIRFRLFLAQLKKYFHMKHISQLFLPVGVACFSLVCAFQVYTMTQTPQETVKNGIIARLESGAYQTREIQITENSRISTTSQRQKYLAMKYAKISSMRSSQLRALTSR